MPTPPPSPAVPGPTAPRRRPGRWDVRRVLQVAVAVIVLVELFADLRHVIQRLRHTVTWWWEGVERHDSLRAHLTELALIWRQFEQHPPS